jgi:hypothetical protein
MNSYLIFSIVFTLFMLIMIVLDKKYKMLRDASTAVQQPYSFSKTQLAWWTAIIFSGIITIVCSTHILPNLDATQIFLLGLSSATTLTASAVTSSDKNAGRNLHQNDSTAGFLLDILSDANGVSMARLQCVIINIGLGGYFAFESMCCNMLYIFTPTYLGLLSLSSATYLGAKTFENK